MERERSMMVSLARGAERANIAAAAARGPERASGHVAVGHSFVPWFWLRWIGGVRGGSIGGTRVRRAERRRRPSFLPYRFSETILPGAPPSLPPSAPPVLLPLQRPLEMDPGISLFPLLSPSSFPLSLHISPSQSERGGGPKSA